MESEASQQDIDARITLLQRRRNALSPAGRVPAEVLSEILLLSTRTPDVPNQFKQRTENYIPTLCHVSHFWRSVALGCPRLWVEVDLNATTKARRVEFAFEQAQPMPVSLHVDLEGSGGSPSSHSTRGQYTTGLDTAARLIWEMKLSSLNFRGSMESLQGLILVLPNGPSLRAIRINLSGEPDRDWRWEGPNLSRHIVLQGNVPQLRSLVLTRCTISPMSPLIHSASSLTNADLMIPQSSNITELTDALRKIPRIEALTLRFVHPLQRGSPNEASVSAVPMPSITSLILIGPALTTTTLLSFLRMPVLLLNIQLHCVVAQGEAREGLLDIGGRIFGAVGQARSLNDGRSPEDTPPFSPHDFGVGIQSFGGRYLVGFSKVVKGEAIQPTLITTLMLSFMEQETLRVVGCEDWLPLAAMPDPEHSHGFWSVAELGVLQTGDAFQYPDAFWGRVSACPALVTVRIAAKDVLKFLPYIAGRPDHKSSPSSQDEDRMLWGEDADTLQASECAFPFPSLRRVEVQGPNLGQHPPRAGSHASCNSVLGPFVQALEERRKSAMLHPRGGEVKTLDSLTFFNCDSAPSKALVATLSTLVHRFIWRRREPAATTAIRAQPKPRLVVRPVPERSILGEQILIL